MLQASRLAFDPLTPWPVLWTLVAAASALWLVYLWLRGRSWLLRALALSVLALALANPLWVEEQREPLKDVVALVLDRSESMNFRGRNEAAQAAYEKLKKEIEADETLELRTAETDPGADGTDLYAALQSAMSDAPRDRVAGSILITDGQIHDLPGKPSDAAELGPVHGLVVGAASEVDRRIEIISAPSFSIVDNDIELIVQVDDPTAKSMEVGISINGDPQRPQTVPVGQHAKLKVRLPRRGSNLVVLQVPPLKGELTLANNFAAADMSGVRDRLRVLLITGEPHAGSRVWRDLLKSDPAVDLVHFTILRPPSKQDLTPNDEMALIAFPRRELFEQKLSQFDLVIFDHELRRDVLERSYLHNIARYVEQGGALLVAAGPPYEDSEILYQTPLGSVLPGEETGRVVTKAFVPQLTDLGKRHSVTAGLPTDPAWGPWRRYMELKPTRAKALLQTPDGAPLLILNRVGEGRVASFLSDQIWLWARGYEGGGPYAELIRRTAHWLMKEPQLEEELLTLVADSRGAHADLRTLADTPAPLTLTGPDGAAVSLEWKQSRPGEYRADAAAKELGLYIAKSGTLKGVALHGPAHPKEYVNVEATTALLQPVATATLGGVSRIGVGPNPNVPSIRRIGARGNAAGDGWIGLRKRGAYAVRTTRSITLLPDAVGMALAVLFMMMAWRREGR